MSRGTQNPGPPGPPHAMRRAAVIMAGGSGTRLWPLSRKSRPKQLLRLVDGKSLIRLAYERASSVVAPEDIFVIALASHLPAIAAELPQLLPQNLIGEPVGRDTANAIALSAALLHHANPETVMGVFTADHVIRPLSRFAEFVELGYKLAEQHGDALVTFGVRPREPHTELGYVERGAAVAPGVCQVRAFKEKPDTATARQYLASGNYLWNSGMFVWKTSAILDQLHRHIPQTHETMMRLAPLWDTVAGPTLALEAYPRLSKISIDFAVMEKAQRVLCVEMDLDWLDVGHWTSLPAIMGRDKYGNTTVLPRAIVRDAGNNILVAEDNHLIAAVSVQDLVIVNSGDATLVCRRQDLDKIKGLVGDLAREFPGEYE